MGDWLFVIGRSMWWFLVLSGRVSGKVILEGFIFKVFDNGFFCMEFCLFKGWFFILEFRILFVFEMERKKIYIKFKNRIKILR